MNDRERDFRLLVFPCPECSRPSDSIKAYTTGTILFLFIAAVSWRKQEFGCPSCIRGKILKFSLINIPTANVIWPILIFPWTLILLLRSLTRGHSKSVLEIIRRD